MADSGYEIVECRETADLELLFGWWHDSISCAQYRYVFILAHMRSGSTLLAHLLASHPDFVGAGETKVCYRTPADLPQLILKTCELLHKPISAWILYR